MTVDDVGEVYKIESMLFSDPWPKNSFKNEVRQKDISFPFIAEENKRIVGYIICWYYVNDLHIGNIAVIPEKQRQGIGTFLLNQVFDYFTDYKKAYLEVRESNKKAINLYESFGFETILRRKSYYTNGEDALVMVKINTKTIEDL
jgi:ribosomal-protein-alanine N-acetyltransferase